MRNGHIREKYLPISHAEDSIGIRQIRVEGFETHDCGWTRPRLPTKRHHSLYKHCQQALSMSSPTVPSYARIVVKDLLAKAETNPSSLSTTRKKSHVLNRHRLSDVKALSYASATRGAKRMARSVASVQSTATPTQATASKRVQQPFRYYCILDVEATCAENDRTLPNEVIEFPVILLDARTLTRVAEFRSFVRPRLSRTLSSFCTSLTGIRQEQVDAAASFPVVLKRFRAFLKAHGVGPNNMRFITDGPCDIRDFVTTSCRAHGIPVPRIFRGYVNVRKLAQRIYGGKGATINFKGMMRLFGLELEGRQHSGIDDARNITRAVIRMMEDGCVFQEQINCLIL